MMSVHAAPKTHPGGVQGALFKLVYHAPVTSSPINKLPKASAPKLIIKNNIKR